MFDFNRAIPNDFETRPSYKVQRESIDNTYIEQKKRDSLMFDFLSNEDKQFVINRVGIEEYNKMSQNMKETLLHCK